MAKGHRTTEEWSGIGNKGSDRARAGKGQAGGRGAEGEKVGFSAKTTKEAVDENFLGCRGRKPDFWRGHRQRMKFFGMDFLRLSYGVLLSEPLRIICS